MTQKDDQNDPRLADKKKKADNLSTALRENLRRRKLAKRNKTEEDNS